MKKGSVIILLCVLFFQGIHAQNSNNKQAWLDRKFAMFIHFGLYSELGGVWKGKPVTQGYSEQIQSHGGIFSDWYADVAKSFNPTQWNADSIVDLAIRAGMKSIVITTKHHDGFCMYHSQYTDFNIVDATPFKRDVVKELSEACAKKNLAMGIYFSLIDWHFPQAYPISSHNADPITPEHHEYNKKQVTELMRNYGQISEIWFDMGSLTQEQSKELYTLVHHYQPNCMVSGRIGNGYGDFSVMGDNQIPETVLAAPWQTPASMFPETWGYRSWQKYVDVSLKAEEKIKDLVKVVSAGGNYILNIGPKGDGSVVPFEKEVLLSVGQWMDVYGQTIYATQSNPFQQFFDWGHVTAKDQMMYLFVYKMPENNIIKLPRLTGKIKSIKNFHTQKPIAFKTGNQEIDITLPAGFLKEKPFEVIAVTFSNPFTVLPKQILSGITIFDTANATNYHSYAGANYYLLKETTIYRKWFFDLPAGNYLPVLSYTDQEAGQTVNISIDGVTHSYTLDKQNGKYELTLPATILKKQLFHTLEITPAFHPVPHADMGLSGLKVTLKAQ